MMKCQHPITRPPLADAVANHFNRSGNLVTEDLWRREEPVLDLLNISSADATGADSHQYFARGDNRQRHLLRNHATLAAVNSSPHPLALLLEFRRRSGFCSGGCHWLMAWTLRSIFSSCPANPFVYLSRYRASTVAARVLRTPNWASGHSRRGSPASWLKTWTMRMRPESSTARSKSQGTFMSAGSATARRATQGTSRSLISCITAKASISTASAAAPRRN